MGSVTNDSPDESRYHTIREGTMIPRARKSGESAGFDHNAATRVVVDPDQAGGGFEIDLPGLVKTDFFAAKSAEASAVENSSNFLKQMNDRLQEVQVQTEREKIVESDYIEPVPVAATPVAAVAARRLGDIGNQSPNQRIDSGSSYQEHIPPEPVVLQTPSLVNNDFNVLLQQLLVDSAQQRQLINKMLVEQAEIKSNPTVELQAEPAPEVAVKEPELPAQVPTGIDFLDSTEDPIVPKYDVLFEMQLGTMAAKYHGVVIGDKCIALIYDTRFPYGNQYLPPAMGEEQIAVRVPKYGDNVYNCNSLGLHWTLGCLDVVILIKQ